MIFQSMHKKHLTKYNTHDKKKSKQTKKREKLPQLDEENHRKPTGNIILNSQKLDTSQLSIRNKARIYTLNHSYLSTYLMS